jgi:hypothetical protein
MKIKTISSSGIVFDGDTRITHNHESDCCENVYADWQHLRDESGVMEHDFKDLEIEKVNNSGFRLEGFFVPCYNEQNGYYSSDLELIIKYSNLKSKHINIGDCVKDEID